MYTVTSSGLNIYTLLGSEKDRESEIENQREWEGGREGATLNPEDASLTTHSEKITITM